MPPDPSIASGGRPIALPLRLKPGVDLRRGLEAAAPELLGGSGFVVCGIGSFSEAALRFAAEETAASLSGPLELLSLSGTVTPDGAHLHATVADATGRVFGGHVSHGCIVRTTAEVLLVGLPGWQLRREHDPATGYPELVVARSGRDAAGAPSV